MPTLKIRISGLCFFAFNPPLDKNRKGPPPPTKATLLLQKLTSARLLRNTVAGQPDVLEQHFPLLAFDLEDRDPASNRNADFAAHPDRTGRLTRGISLLFGDDVTIKTDKTLDETVPENLKFHLTRPADPASLNLTRVQEESLFWVPTLEDAFPNQGAVAPDLLERLPGANKAILARVQLSHGTLKTLELSDLACRFVPPGSATFQQRVAIALCLEIPFQDWVEFNFVRRAEGGEEESALRLKPSKEGNLSVDIKNMEIDELIGVKRFYSRGTVADFEVYSELLAQPIVGANGPTYLLPYSPGNPAGTGGLGTCPPGAR